ncbi:MAG: hypothetical protein A2504_03080 [Bdellovibrionales bacterium RIFOXYD12_FULL_39_22]|nr:MAG: hypothetical protein A2385_05795 [Bdellovibrionales bacterium RIFOXYB1_FULL_39_21]OFZ42266.1 MAG: hypothetical protein A2485_15825 [Bdellovibrionales bacterium RIFOXYC12_FULL_39_17]OFZ46642.1 MAG: hypothetical protein A2404_03845 [Bdellovibrionales bacterium RIFOXYC1_FULL_39_130]OFZ76081.1 MAG: hypothetical protein A2560_03305 [Bdellovibrionales bacterium RIFOXYD1_FULL_39_84]OFZ93065.1 MAG: hypothetical protein A2504_03080 [Bdellovibrionales bacterium RIFOXYD12_FULL_39_22]HLE09959.1 Sp
MENNTIAKIRKVRIPIKLKLIAVVILLVASSLSYYAYFALKLFREDKSAYIYETGLNTSEAIAKQVASFLDHALQITDYLGRIYANTPEQEKMAKSIFEANKNFIEFSIYKRTEVDGEFKLIFAVSDEISLSGQGLPVDYFIKYSQINPIPFLMIEKKRRYVEGYNPASQFPHLVLATFDAEKNEIYVARVKMDDLADLIANNKIYEILIIDKSGRLFLKKNLSAEIPQAKALFYNSLVDSVDRKDGVSNYVDENGTTFLVAHNQISGEDLFVFAEISKDRAFLAATTLMNKSLYFGIFLISIAIIIGIIFSRTITSSIEKLFSATSTLAQSDFKNRVELHSHDEIGALSDSFNYMADEIVRYMGQMGEKIRLENELKVAKLVQESFFPANNLKFGKLEIAAFYEPATECGGDWWGHLQINGKTVLMIADATGHGVPAALLTATANCSASNLEIMAQSDPSLLNSPAKMMRIVNKAVCDIGSQILMTFFIAVIDTKKNELIYANASHNHPLHFIPGQSGEEISKQNLHPLMDSNGPRLGERKDASYNDCTISFCSGESIVFFTDGIVECTNKEEKPWGNRNFLKSIINNINLESDKFRDNVVGDAKDFFAAHPLDDDITLIVTKFT